MEDPQKQLQALSDEYQKLQTELEEIVEGRQKLEAQQQESKGVQKEFKDLDNDANIYKLIGPVLLKQDRNEAMMAVDSRLDFIDKEIKRIETQIASIEEKNEKKKIEIMSLQSQQQQQQQPGAAAA